MMLPATPPFLFRIFSMFSNSNAIMSHTSSKNLSTVLDDVWYHLSEEDQLRSMKELKG